MQYLFIFGYGYVAKALIDSAKKIGIPVGCSSRSFHDSEPFLHNFYDLSNELKKATHIVSTVPPVDGVDPVLEKYRENIQGKKIVYISSTSVYGFPEVEGEITEDTQPDPEVIRFKSEQNWRKLGAIILRCTGIYGPEQNTIIRVLEGRIPFTKTDITHNRVHVEDIIQTIFCLLRDEKPPKVLNCTGDYGTSQNALIKYICDILKRPYPPVLDTSDLPEKLQYYCRKKNRYSNSALKIFLKKHGRELIYPDIKPFIINITKEMITHLKPAIALNVIEETKSTNKLVKDLLEKGEMNDWQAVIAKRQTKGYGQRGKTWEGYEGNLFLSFTSPTYPLPLNNQYAFLVVVALGDLISKLGVKVEFSYKWPNDLFIEGRKCAGFLIEKVDDTNIIGLGVNIVCAPKIDQPTTCLNNYIQTNAIEFTKSYLENFVKFYNIWHKSGFAPIKDLWMARAKHLNEYVKISGKHGIFTDIADDGAMILQKTDNVSEKVYAAAW